MKKQIVIRNFTKLYRDEEEKAFNMRFFLGISKIRDHICNSRKDFDCKKFNEYFEAIFKNLDEALLAKNKAIEIINSIEERIRENLEKYLDDGMIPIDTPPELNLFLKDFFIRGKMVIDLIGNGLGNLFGLKISFFFGANEKSFDKDLKKFQESLSDEQKSLFNNLILPRIKEERGVWIGEFCEIRRKIEHSGFQFPYPNIKFSGNAATLDIYQIKKGEDIRTSLKILWEYIFEICEDLIALMLSQKIGSRYMLKLDFRKERKSDEPKYEVVINPELMGEIMERVKG